MGKVKEFYFEEINSRDTVEDMDYQYQEWLKQEELKEEKFIELLVNKN